MDLLQSVLGGQQRTEVEEFANRYEQGAPWDGIGDDEAVRRFDQVAPTLSRDDFERSAEQSFGRLEPQQRAELGRYLQQQAPQYIQDVDGDGRDDRLQDPRYLAQVTGRMQQEQPGLLGQLLGGGGGLLGGDGRQTAGGGGLLSSPIAKAALGGIAAMAFRRMTSGR